MTPFMRSKLISGEGFVGCLGVSARFQFISKVSDRLQFVYVVSDDDLYSK